MDQNNTLPMTAGNAYNENCHQQTLIMEGSLPLFDDINLGSNLTIVDYGCSQGRNSIAMMQRVLNRMAPSSTASLVFEDLPSNEFASLIRLLPELSASNPTLKIYPSLIPRSFYEPVIAPATVDIGFTSSTIHWLKRMPLLKPPTETVSEYYAKRTCRNAPEAEENFREFLTLRGQEIKSGGYFIIACFGSFTEEEITRYKDALILRHRILFQAAEKLANEGKLPLKAMEKINVPIYDRSEEEFRSGIEELKDTWVMEEYYRKMIPHPAYDKYLKACELEDADENSKTEAAKAYAGALIDWLVAVMGDMIKNWWRESGVEDDKVDEIYQELLVVAKDLLWKEGPGGAEIPLMYTRLRRA
ncbi:hypothetical protein TWF173_002276 [Orbilia oligospora]|uniref:S-adenosyl-L-methionine-dependent methyltransferase n=2 Tax=Orbilia oligospora TaxID=2813651 RepID=G1XBU4_ARTOA|nr:hypothetical protein AOL_s00078g391 [Orbilia oligospora ATCC 24927]EGX49358.1 hypothetical protein AOL_s00078g391 [Orbilia oligospora ATCC 24927]KAF3288582.1 hypothetical protein TWF970_005645 [Orbilia oligospora]KAF3316434.1 hypothetical protein TWF173_002276 [Orbilia oligospora]